MKNSLKNNIESNLYIRRFQNIRNKLTSQFESSRRFSLKSLLRLFFIKLRCYICDEKDYKVQKCNAFKINKKLIRILKKKKSKKIFFIKSFKENKRL